MNKQQLLGVMVAVVLLAAVAALLSRFFRNRIQRDDLTYFYDLSERKLFVAPRTRVPPIRGINDDQLDGMRAVVISAGGNPKDTAGRRIAYLEKYSPELKRQLESQQAGAEASPGAADRISRGAAQSMIFVRRLDEETWYPVNTAEAEKIMNEWQVPAPNGALPVVCSP